MCHHVAKAKQKTQTWLISYHRNIGRELGIKEDNFRRLVNKQSIKAKNKGLLGIFHTIMDPLPHPPLIFNPCEPVFRNQLQSNQQLLMHFDEHN